MCQEKEEEEDLPVLQTAWMQPFRNLKEYTVKIKERVITAVSNNKTNRINARTQKEKKKMKRKITEWVP